MNSKEILKYGIGILILEIILLGLWIYQMKPDPSTSIGIVLILPFLFGLNLIIGLIFYFLKKPLSKLFLINSIICPLIFYAFWSLWFIYWNERNYEDFSFGVDKRKLEVSLSKTSDYFSISDLTNKPNGSTTGLYFGKYERKGDSIKLTDGETKMYIIKNKLIGFPEKPTEIKLTRTE
ncbi:hypothetical protein I5168_00925 [Nonlabens sp. SCSIO 43208]|uniref:hypothetical protein n=1 Tax=Nonlabens sp. SCSIO 43208 TaxID=2793009 RepID=UPI003D6B43D6